MTVRDWLGIPVGLIALAAIAGVVLPAILTARTLLALSGTAGAETAGFAGWLVQVATFDWKPEDERENPS